MKTDGEWWYISVNSEPWHRMDVTSQLHTSPASPMGNEFHLPCDGDSPLSHPNTFVRNRNTIPHGAASCSFTTTTEVASQQSFNWLWSDEQDHKKFVRYSSSWTEIRHKAFRVWTKHDLPSCPNHGHLSYSLLCRKLLLCVRVRATHLSLPCSEACIIHSNRNVQPFAVPFCRILLHYEGFLAVTAILFHSERACIQASVMCCSICSV
jgi:hypothetical protein